MKKILSIYVFLIVHLSLFAQFSGNIQTQSSELSFSKQNGYDLISLAGGVTTSQIGAPQLPIKMISYVIPYDKKVASITINNSTYQVLTDTFLIFPFQPPRFTNDTTTPVFVQPDSLIYGSNNPYPDSLVKIVFQGNNMGYNIVTLYFYPIQYLPFAKQVKLFTSIQFTLNYVNNDNMPALPQKQSENMNNITLNFIKSMISNPSDLQTISGGPLQIIGSNTQQKLNLKTMPVLECDIPEYIIITNNNDINGQALPLYNGQNMTQIFQQLADWKTQKGVPTIVVTTDEIALNYHGCDLAEKIRNYLKDVYAKWGSKYVLLGGDVNVLPARFVDIPTPYVNDPELDPTDLYYSAIEGNWNANHNSAFGENCDSVDYTAEHFLGRASTENTTEANTFITKVKQYERLLGITTNNYNYVNNLLFMAAYLVRNDSGTLIGAQMPKMKEIADSITYHVNLNKWLLFDNKSVYNGNEELSSATVLNRLRNGIPTGKTHLVFHLDHSGWDGMGTSSTMKGQDIRNTDMDSLNNAPFHQILFTNGCSPNSFHKDCIAERYINNPYGGGVAFIGATTIAYDNELPSVANFTGSIYNYQNSTPHNSHIGVAFSSTYSLTNAPAKMKYNLLGDPEMPVWTTTPHNFAVTVLPANISNVNNQIAVTIAGNSIFDTNNITVCLQKGNEIYQRETRLCSAGHNQTFNFTVNPDTAGSMIVTVTGPNYIPVIDTINVNITAKNLYIFSKTIDDGLSVHSDGNNNQKLDAGETIELDMALKNNGTINTSGVTATLQCCPSPHITLQQSTSNYNTIYAGQQPQSNITKFRFHVDNDAEDGEIANFALQIHDNAWYSITRNFSLQLQAPKLVKDINTYTTSINNDMIIDANDHVSLFVDLLNDGSADARGLTATLSSTSPNITVIPTNVTYPDIPHFIKQQNSLPFQFTVGTAYTNEPLTLRVQNVYGKTWTFNFTLKKPTAIISNIAFKNTSNSIELFWNQVTSICSGYNIYRSNTPNGVFVKLNQQPAMLSTYLDNGLTSKTKYYYKISYIDADGNESEKSPTLTTWTTYPYHTGWPITPPNELRIGNEGTPNVYDIYGDGNKEIFFTASGSPEGSILAFKHDGTELYNIDNDPNTVSGFAKFNIAVAAETALADINHDGKGELIVSTHDWNVPGERKIYVYSTTGDNNNDHKPDLLWSSVTGGSNLRGAVIADMDNNSNTLECFPNTFLNDSNQFSIYGNKLSIFNSTGSIYKQISIDGSANKFEGISAMSAIADIDNDGNKEIVVGYMSGLYVYHKNSSGNYVKQWVDSTGCNGPDDYTTIRMDSPPVLADIDNDGDMEIIYLRMKRPRCYIDIKHHNDSFATGWGNNNHLGGYFPYKDTKILEKNPMISVADINNDGYLEIITGNAWGIYAWDRYGNLLPNFPIVFGFALEFTAPLIADIDGDDEMEIIIASNETGKIYAYNSDGSIVDFFPLDVNCQSTPCIADIDNDGKNEIIAVGGGKLYVWDTEGDSRKIEWGQIRSDAQNTGVYHKNNCQFASNGTPININGSEVWADYKRVNTTVTINSGGTLIIPCRIDFTEQAKIIVKPGGSLIINGGKLTNACGGHMWQGVEVLGNYFLSQHDVANQGRVSIYNGGTIENAVIGIATLNESYATKGGGVIEADGAKFINNQTAIKMQAYQNFGYDYPSVKIKDESHFYNCEFKTTGVLNDTTIPFDAFVDMQDINGINFISCSFTNPPNGANAFTGTGIRSTNSSFRVMGLCSETQSGQPCPDELLNYSTFKNLSYGVKADNYNPLKTITISTSKFENNGKGGVYLGGTTGATITRNLFKVKEINITLGIKPYGIYLDNSTKFGFEGNVFDKAGDAQGGEGVIINNSYQQLNIIYNNTFNNLKYATDAQNDNKGGDTNGLKIKCNDYLFNKFDIIATYDSLTCTNPGVSSSQGETTPSQTAGASNTFSPDADVQLYNEAGSSSFSYYTNMDIPGSWVPTRLTDNGNIFLSNVPNYYYSKQASCPAVLLQPTDNNTLSDRVTTAQQGLNSSRLMLTIWVDGGNTQALKDAINLSYPWEAFELYNNLISLSPYLSDEIMIDAIQREDVLPALMLKYVLLANPQSAKSDAVMEALNNRLNPLPDAWVKEIEEGAEVVSPREQLESNVAYYFQERQIPVNQLKNLYLSDTTGVYQDSLVNLLTNDIESISDYQLAYLNIEKGDFDACDSVMANIPVKYAYRGAELENHQDFVDFFAIVKDLHQNDKDIHDINDDQLHQLRAMKKNDRNYTAAYARAILSRIDKDYDYNEPILYPDENAPLKTAKDKPKSQQLKVENVLKVYPNPAKEYFIVEYTLTDNLNNAVFEIIDATGRLVKSIQINKPNDQLLIKTEGILSGLYYCRLLNNQKQIGNIKISIKI